MIQTYEKVNKLHQLKSHANEGIDFFFTLMVFRWAYVSQVYLTLLFKSYMYICCT